MITDSQRLESPVKWRKSAVMTDLWRLINGKELYDVKLDPGQKNNIAENYPSVVQRLRDAYEKWWADSSKRFDEYCRIIIGSDKENPARLSCHDWHTDQVPWNQMLIRKGLHSNGYWAVDIAKRGKYEFTLRRWPEELDKPINASIPGRSGLPGITDLPEGKALNIKTARLKIADVDVKKAVPKNAKAVTFKVELKAGETELQTWFTDIEGKSRGVYYVYVKRL